MTADQWEWRGRLECQGWRSHATSENSASLRIILALAILMVATSQLDAASAMTTTGSLHQARYSHGTAVLPTGKVLVTGGYNGVELASCEIYDHQTGTWSLTGALAHRRRLHTTTVLRNGNVLVTGGAAGGIWNIGYLCELYDPMTGTWSATGSMTNDRLHHTATVLRDGRVLVVGGYGFNDSAWSPYVPYCEIYDPDTGTWSATGTLHEGRHGHAATLLPDGKVLVAGGGTGFPTATCEVYDPATELWSVTNSMSVARQYLSLVLLPNGRALAIGGVFSSRTSEWYDPATGAWSVTGSMADDFSGSATILLPNGKVLVGGNGNNNSALYDLDTGTWSPQESLSTGRGCNSAALLPNGKVLFAGGSLPSADCEIFDPGAGFLTAGQPTITDCSDPLVVNAPLALTGTLFTGISEASSGAYWSAASNFPLVEITSGVDATKYWLAYDPAIGCTATAVTTEGLNGSPIGPVTVRVIVNGIPSDPISRTFLVGYPVVYDANGATGGSLPASQSKLYGVTLSLAANSGGLENAGLVFSGWNTVVDGSGVPYPEGADYTVDAAVILFAQWTSDSAPGPGSGGSGFVTGSGRDGCGAGGLSGLGLLVMVLLTGHRFRSRRG